VVVGYVRTSIGDCEAEGELDKRRKENRTEKNKIER